MNKQNNGHFYRYRIDERKSPIKFGYGFSQIKMKLLEVVMNKTKVYRFRKAFIRLKIYNLQER